MLCGNICQELTSEMTAKKETCLEQIFSKKRAIAALILEAPRICWLLPSKPEFAAAAVFFLGMKQPFLSLS